MWSSCRTSPTAFPTRARSWRGSSTCMPRRAASASTCVGATPGSTSTSRRPTAGSTRLRRRSNAWLNASFGRERYDDIVDAITAWNPDCWSPGVHMPCVKRSAASCSGSPRTGMVFKLTDPETHVSATSRARTCSTRWAWRALPPVGRRAARAGRRVGAARGRGGGAGSLDQPFQVATVRPVRSSGRRKRQARW